jgi:hypothetical protein
VPPFPNGAFYVTGSIYPEHTLNTGGTGTFLGASGEVVWSRRYPPTFNFRATFTFAD